jgi:hypothetical protein
MEQKDVFRMEDKMVAEVSVVKKDSTKFEDWFNVKIYDKEGNLKVDEDHKSHNTMATNGIAMIMDQLLASPSYAKVTDMAFGLGSPSGTALGNEALRVTFTSKTRSGNIVTMVATCTSITGTVTEAGLFNQHTFGGDMMCSGTCNHTLAPDDSLVITWHVTGS